MTYNFDVDAWYARERARLEALKARGDLDDAGLADALEELERRVNEMQARLDGSFPVGSRDAFRQEPKKK